MKAMLESTDATIMILLIELSAANGGVEAGCGVETGWVFDASIVGSITSAITCPILTEGMPAAEVTMP